MRCMPLCILEVVPYMLEVVNGARRVIGAGVHALHAVLMLFRMRLCMLFRMMLCTPKAVEGELRLLAVLE